MRFAQPVVVLVALLAHSTAWAQAEAAPAWLELKRADIDAVAFEPEHTTVRLSPSAALRLRQMTRDTIGRTLEVRIDGMTAVSVWVQAEIASGLLRVPRPSSELRQRLSTAVLASP
jgi:hypothetical protein